MSESSEEKKHEPSHRRLSHLRRAGDVPHAHEMLGAVSLVTGLVLLFVTGPTVWRLFVSLFAHGLEHHATMADSWNALRSTTAALFAFACGFMIIVGLAYVAALVVDAGGVVISMKSLVFDLKRLNPATTIKEKFGLRFVVEFVRELLKSTAFVGAALVVLIRRGHDIAWSISCGPSCVASVGLRTLEELLIAAALLQLLSGLLDLRISRALHAHKNRMTETDMKREQKEEYGSNEIRKHRRQTREAVRNEPATAHVRQAALALRAGNRLVVLSHESAGEGPPFVVAVADADGIDALLAECRAHKIRVIEDDEAVASVGRTGRGSPIPESSYAAVGACFRKAGLL